jgi:hypothetical protein
MKLVEISVDKRALDALATQLQAVGGKVSTAMARAVNHVGNKGYTRVVRVLAGVMGTKQSAIKKSVVRQLASAKSGCVVYRIRASAPAVSLKEFDAKQTTTGISAKPWMKRRVFPHTFFLPTLGGHVFVRSGGRRVMVKGKYAGKVRQPIRKLWGPVLANELLRNQSRAEFERAVAELPARLQHELQAILKGYAPK